MPAQFVCLRFFIVPVEQHLFTKPVAAAIKLGWFRDECLRSREYRTKEGAEYALRITERTDSYVIGKLSRKRILEVHEKGDEDIANREVEDWPYLDFYADMAQQVVVIRDNSAVVREPGMVARVLTHMANEAMFLHGYATSFEPLVRPESFWQEIERSEGVFAVKFKLKSPNFFGASSEANEALRELRGVFNNTETDIVLKNEQGKLTLPHDVLDTYRDYADKGGGSWSLTIKRGKRKKRIKSEDRALRITFEIDEGAEVGAILRQVLRQFFPAA